MAEHGDGDDGEQLIYPLAAGQVKQGMMAILKGKPCKITAKSVSKTGKHGHAKCKFRGQDIFTKKLSLIHI